MDDLFEELKIQPKEMKYYLTAFQHSSYVNENHLKADYERLEFLGDAVLELVMSDYLFENLDVKEGDLTKLRASYVCENALYVYSTGLNLSKYIKVGHGEEQDGGRFKKVIMADIFEALMGAIYLDLGFETAREVILKVTIPYITNPNIVFFSDYKSALQEFVQTEQRSLVYEIIDETGPAHNKKFTVEVKIDNMVYGTGTAGSKKEAEQEAAHAALMKLAVK
jgi:ribonuclease-3